MATFPEPILNLPEADIPLKGIRAYLSQGDSHQIIFIGALQSERHGAFVVGLGTFSLSRSIITRLGSVGRCGSVIVDCYLEPTQRASTEIDEYCSNCGVCAKRCPPQAIDKTSKDNEICMVHVRKEKAKYNPRYGCIKCQAECPVKTRFPLDADKPPTGILIN